MLLDASRPIYTACMGDMPPGSVFAGHRIEAVAGRGGMGVVYRARQLSLDRVVALKVIAPALTQDEAIRRRFLRESRVAASIDHPHVIPIYYTGEEGGVAYIAMRHVAGDDLRTLVRRDGPLEPGRGRADRRRRSPRRSTRRTRPGSSIATSSPRTSCSAQGDHAYLTDFGLTKHVLSEAGDDEDRALGRDARLRLARADPRRARRRARRRLRARLRPVLRADRPAAVHARRRRGEAVGAPLRAAPPPSARRRPGCRRRFDAVIARALAKEPAQRFQSAGDLGRAAIAAAAAGAPPAATRSSPPAPPRRSRSTPAPPAPRSRRPSRRRAAAPAARGCCSRPRPPRCWPPSRVAGLAMRGEGKRPPRAAIARARTPSRG